MGFSSLCIPLNSAWSPDLKGLFFSLNGAFRFLVTQVLFSLVGMELSKQNKKY